MNEYQLRRTVDPTVEPVTLSDLQDHVLAYNSSDSAKLTATITTARELFELHTGMVLIEQTWEMLLPRFYKTIRIPKPPFRSVSSIQYYDSDAALQTLAASIYQVSAHGILTEKLNQSYPSTESYRSDAVIVTFKAGVYASDGASPEAVNTTPGGGSPDNGNPNHLTGKYTIAQQAIMALVLHLHENRGVVAPVQLFDCPMAYQAMVNACRVEWV